MADQTRPRLDDGAPSPEQIAREKFHPHYSPELLDRITADNRITFPDGTVGWAICDLEDGRRLGCKSDGSSVLLDPDEPHQ